MAGARIFLVRHGRTDWNAARVFRGRADRPLDEAGVREAEAAARHLAAEPIAAVYSSPLVRAVRTAEEFARPRGLGVGIVEALTDMDFGQATGVPLDDLAARDPTFLRQWEATPHLVRFPGGESLDDVRARTLAAFLEIASEHQGETVLAVAHRVVNKVLVCALLGLGCDAFWRVKQDTACLNRIVVERGKPPVVEMVNDTCHLAGAVENRLFHDF